jgi:hypothetical protein
MRSKWIVFSSVLIVALGLTALLGGSSRADTTTPVTQLTGFHQIVVDSADGYVFLSEGVSSGAWYNGTQDSSGIVVTNLSGTYVATVDAGDGVEGIALSPAGGTLYAALGGTAEVAAIDISTITQPQPTQTYYPLQAGDIPYDLAVQGDKVWVSYDASTTAGNGEIGDINLAATTPAAAFEPGTAPVPQGLAWWSAPEIATDPDDNGVLVAIQEGQSLTDAATYNTTTDPATTLASETFLGGSYSAPATSCYGGEDITVVPGGSQFIAACQGLAEDYVYSVGDLTNPVSHYTTGTGPDSIAIAAQGTVAAGVSGNFQDTSGPSASYVYQPGGGELNVIGLGTTTRLAPHGLAWSADGGLYAVLADTTTDSTTGTTTTTYSLRVIDEPTVTLSALSLSGPSTVSVTKGISLSGKLSLSTGALPPSGSKITITRADGSSTRTFTAVTTANGSFTLTDATKPPLGKYTYTASYDGTATIAPSTTTHSVTVAPFGTSLSITTGATTFNYRSTIHVTAHLGTTYTNRTVSIYAQWDGYRGKALLKTGRVNSRGDLTVSYSAPHSTTFSAVFTGDAHYAARTVSHDVGVRASVAESIGGYYTSTHYGSTLYRVYHHTASLQESVAVAPNKSGECVKVEVQIYYQGKWYADLTTGCGSLNSASKISGLFSLSQATGYRYRIRADYVRSSKDVSNLSNDSGWLYFVVVK